MLVTDDRMSEERGLCRGPLFLCPGWTVCTRRQEPRAGDAQDGMYVSGRHEPELTMSRMDGLEYYLWVLLDLAVVIARKISLSLNPEKERHLVDNFIPEVPVMQWILSIPYTLLFLFSSNPK